MRILIADYQARRYTRLIAELVELGISRTDIDIVNCFTAAFERLEHNCYDLLLLDIILPKWPESDADHHQHSMDLLLELHNGTELNKPTRILGITADKSIAEKAAINFETWTWAVVEFSEVHDEWKNRILNCVRYMQNSGKLVAENRPIHEVDLAIICALETPELVEVLKLPWNWSASRPLDDIVFVHDGYFFVNERKITVCAAFASRMGMVSTALLSASIITHLRPRLLAMCGICAGVRGKVKYGDILLADPAWDFQSGKRVWDKENTQFSISPHQLHPQTVVRTHVEQIRGDNQALSQIATKYHTPTGTIPRIFIGPVASGSAVLADGQVINEIKQQHRDLIGVEMEIYGMYAAANSASAPQPRVFALKSVCDFADPDKGDDMQAYAAYTSANVMRLLMERFGPRLLD